MDPGIKARLTPAVVAEAAFRFGGAARDLRDMGAFESFLFETRIDGRRAVMRIAARRPVVDVDFAGPWR